jgi:hypothetical protein
MYVTMKGYRVGWEVGEDNLLMVSVGTGSFDGPKGIPYIPHAEGFNTAMVGFFSLLSDAQVLARTLMQWMSRTPTPSVIDSDIGDLADDLLGDRALISYLRYDLELTPSGLATLLEADADLAARARIDSLHELDTAANTSVLWELGRRRGRELLEDAHFPGGFDLEAGP